MCPRETSLAQSLYRVFTDTLIQSVDDIQGMTKRHSYVVINGDAHSKSAFPIYFNLCAWLNCIIRRLMYIYIIGCI